MDEGFFRGTTIVQNRCLYLLWPICGIQRSVRLCSRSFDLECWHCYVRVIVTKQCFGFPIWRWPLNTVCVPTTSMWWQRCISLWRIWWGGPNSAGGDTTHVNRVQVRVVYATCWIFCEHTERVWIVEISGCIRVVYNGNKVNETIYRRNSCVGMFVMEIWNNVKNEGGDWDSNPGLRDTSRCIKKKRKSTTGLEPAISRFVGGRLIYWATRTHLTVIYVHTPIHTLIPSSHSTYTRIITDKGLVQHPHPALLCRPQSFDKPNMIML